MFHFRLRYLEQLYHALDEPARNPQDHDLAQYEQSLCLVQW